MRLTYGYCFGRREGKASSTLADVAASRRFNLNRNPNPTITLYSIRELISGNLIYYSYSRGQSNSAKLLAGGEKILAQN